MDPKLVNILFKATREHLTSSPNVMTPKDIVMPADIQFQAGDLTELVKSVFAILSSYQPKKGSQDMNKNALAIISFFIAVTLKNQFPEELSILKQSAKLKTAPVINQDIKPTVISDLKQDATSETSLIQEIAKPTTVVDGKEEAVTNPTPHYYIRPKAPSKPRPNFNPVPGPVGRGWRMCSLVVQEDDPDLIPRPVRHRPKNYPMSRPPSHDDLLDESWYSTQKKARRFYRGSKRRDTYRVVKYGLLERVLMKELLLAEHDTFAKHFVSDCIL